VVDGKPSAPEGLWPSDAEIDAIVKASVKPEQFRKVYDPMFAARGHGGRKVSPLYDWRPQSTYIRRPPYWEGALAGERTLRGMRPLAVLPDNITTDHLSPSNAILLDSAAGEYLAKMGLPEEDFNSYATHRGDHLTASAPPSPTPSWSTRWPWSTAGEEGLAGPRRTRRQGHAHVGSHRNLHGPQAAADHHRRRRLRPGLSRDWAAKGVRLAGVEAIVAEGFERIHRTNLIGMGVLPLEFKPGTTA
jgi:aconitase A